MQDSTKHFGLLFSWPWHATLLSQEKIEKKFEHEGINVKLTFEAKCSCKWTMAYNLCKYKTPNHLKMVVDHHHFLGGGLCHQKM